MGPNKLLDIYAAPQNFVIQTRTLPEGIPLLFETNRFKGSPGHTTGNLSIVRRSVLKESFEKFTHGFFKQVDWDNILVAGGSVLGCLRGLSPVIELPSDIDVFLYGLTDEELGVRVRVLLAQLYSSLNKALREERKARQAQRLLEGEEEVKEAQSVQVVKTPNALTLIPSLVAYSVHPKVITSFPAVQIITRKYPTKRSIFNSFDVDCCCVGFDEERVWAHPRAQQALVSGVNLVNLAYKNPRSYEHRMLKYAKRGFAILDPAQRPGPTLLSKYLQTADPMNPGGAPDPEAAKKVPVEWLVRCIRRTSGLLQILLANEAENRGVVWATGFDSLISFDGEIDERLLEMEDEGRAVVDADGNLLVFGPLRDPNCHVNRPLACSLKELIREIAVPRAEESEFLRFMAGILPARDANNRKLWERGLYEDEDNELDELLRSEAFGQGPSTSSAQPKPSMSGFSSAASSSISSGSPTFKRRNMGDRGARVAALLPPNSLMELPKVLLLEILQRCAGSSLANLSATCKALDFTITHGTWRRAVERDFGDTREQPSGCRQPEPWNKLYGTLQGLGGLAWRQWDEHPLRLECLPDRRQQEHPFPRVGHATTFMAGDKLIMTGGLCASRDLEGGTFVFDLGTHKWTTQPTFILHAPLFGGPILTRHPAPYELSGRTHHTSTAVSENELLLLFGKQRTSEIPGEPSLVSEALLLDVRNWTYTRVRQEGIHPRLRRSHSACLHPNGNALLVFGGSVSTRVDLSTDVEYTDNPADAGRVFTPGELEILDDLHVLTRAEEGAWRWSQPVASGKAPMARCGHSACVVGRKMVVVGGSSNVISLPNEVYLLDVDTMRWSTLFMPVCFPPKHITFPNAAVAVGRKILLTGGAAETYVIDLDGRMCKKLHKDVFDKQLGRRVPERRTGHSLTKVGVSVYMLGGRLDPSLHPEDLDRLPMENLQILDLIGQRVV